MMADFPTGAWITKQFPCRNLYVQKKRFNYVVRFLCIFHDNRDPIMQ